MEYKITDSKITSLDSIIDKEKLEILSSMQAIVKAFPIMVEQINKCYRDYNERQIQKDRADAELVGLVPTSASLQAIEVFLPQASNEFYLTITYEDVTKELYVEVLDKDAVLDNDRSLGLDKDPYYQPGIYNSDYIEMGDTGYYFRLM